MVKAARAIRAMGPHTLVVKKGEHGVLLFGHESCFAAPALSAREGRRPDRRRRHVRRRLHGLPGERARAATTTALRQAVVMGSTLASFCVEAFSLDRLLTLTRPEIDARYRVFQELTTFEKL